MAGTRDLAELALEALRRGDADAPARFAAAIEADPGNGSLILGEAEALMIAGSDDPAGRLQATLERYPQWAEGHAAFAAMLWELGSTTDYSKMFKAALRHHPATPRCGMPISRPWPE